MKTSHFLFLVIMLYACDFPNSASGKFHSDLGSSDIEIWEQVGMRDVTNGNMLSVSSGNVVTLKITGDDILFGINGDYCNGKIDNNSIRLSVACYTQSPYWVISERTEDTMYIYPRLGAMYHNDLVMKKAHDKCAENCALLPVSGPCEAIVPRYYFDKVSGKCKEFIWGGCHGVVPFETLKACEACECN